MTPAPHCAVVKSQKQHLISVISISVHVSESFAAIFWARSGNGFIFLRSLAILYKLGSSDPKNLGSVKF